VQTRKYERGLSRLMHDDDLYWLVIAQRVQYKLAVTSMVVLITEIQGTSPFQ